MIGQKWIKNHLHTQQQMDLLDSQINIGKLLQMLMRLTKLYA